ncbi:MAG: glycosyltransferase family 2 protein [Phycisphaerales bacterium]
MGETADTPAAVITEAKPGVGAAVPERAGAAFVSVIVPAFNEAENLALLHRRVAAVLDGCVSAGTVGQWELILINDGSRDGTLEVMRDLARQDARVKYVSLSRNFGHELATTAGLDHAEGDAVVLIDADLQDPPEVMADMLASWRRGVDVVYAQRRQRQGETLFKKASAFIFYRLLHRVSEVKIPRDTGDFRLMDRRVVLALREIRENPRFIRGLVSWVGFRQEPVLYDRDARHAGETKYNFSKLLRLSFEALCAFSLAPLRSMIWIGLFVTALSLAVSAMVVIQKVFFKMPSEGYAMLACGIFFLGGVQLTLLGTLAWYVGIIHKTVQNRPLYIVGEERGFGPAGGATGSTRPERQRGGYVNERPGGAVAAATAMSHLPGNSGTTQHG